MAYLHSKESDFDCDPDSIVILVNNLCNGLNTSPDSDMGTDLDLYSYPML